MECHIQVPLVLFPYTVYNDRFYMQKSMHIWLICLNSKRGVPFVKESFSTKGRLFSNFEHYSGKILYENDMFD